MAANSCRVVALRADVPIRAVLVCFRIDEFLVRGSKPVILAELAAWRVAIVRPDGTSEGIAGEVYILGGPREMTAGQVATGTSHDAV